MGKFFTLIKAVDNHKNKFGLKLCNTININSRGQLMTDMNNYNDKAWFLKADDDH